MNHRQIEHWTWHTYMIYISNRQNDASPTTCITTAKTTADQATSHDRRRMQAQESDASLDLALSSSLDCAADIACLHPHRFQSLFVSLSMLMSIRLACYLTHLLHIHGSFVHAHRLTGESLEYHYNIEHHITVWKSECSMSASHRILILSGAYCMHCACGSILVWLRVRAPCSVLRVLYVTL